MIIRFGNRDNFLKEFNPEVQMSICGDKELCLFGDAPTLSTLNMAFGEMTAAMWLVPQLYNLSEFCGCKGKLEGTPLEECSRLIATEYFYLKVSEIMLFFHRFKSGKYGRFYGSVDPLVITTSLREFIRERNYEIEKQEQKEREIEQEESRKKAITYEEYCKRRGREPGVSPLDTINTMMSKKTR